MTQDIVLEKLVLVIALGILSQWMGWKFKVPSIVLLTLSGVLAGPIFGWVNPARDFGELVPVLIKLAIALILFEGGLSLRLHELKQAGLAVRRLVILGLPLAWIIGFIPIHYFVGLSAEVSWVLSAILVVTGPTVILPLIRQTRIDTHTTSLLKWEGIVNDPLGALLAVLVFEYFVSQADTSMHILLSLGIAFSASALLGLGGGYLLKKAIDKDYIPEFLKVPAILSLVFIIFGVANMFQHEAGLLAVTLFGIMVGNTGLVIIHELRRFKENISIFLVSTVFILLTSGLNLEIFARLDWRAVIFLICLLFLVRPASILLATWRSNLAWNERLLVGWIAPRGVVAASMAGLFAPRLIAVGYEDATYLVPLVFAAVFTTVVVHGFSFGWVARKLGLADDTGKGLLIIGASPFNIDLASEIKDSGVPVLIVDNSWHSLRPARLQGLPVYFGEILSENSEQKLDLSAMGKLLAATGNDAYNALVCSAYLTHLGPNNVYQLAMHTRDQDEAKGLRNSARGQIAFKEDVRFESLLGMYYIGWGLKKTQFTEEFGLETYFETNPPDLLPLVLIRENKDLTLVTGKTELKIKPGDTLISYCPPPKS